VPTAAPVAVIRRSLTFFLPALNLMLILFVLLVYAQPVSTASRSA
jgi:hypothetical protein